MKQYLQSCEIIDWQHPAVSAKAKQLAAPFNQPIDITRSCFEFVRDEIQHSGDSKRDEATCSASEVLAHGTGWCYAKSHLLAALLRANHIPAGLCYQRLTVDGDTPPYCLHGLNAVYLESFGWYRIDARGNKASVNAQFTPPVEQLAFAIQYPGEMDLSGIWPEPHPIITQTLKRDQGYIDVLNHLPDIAV